MAINGTHVSFEYPSSHSQLTNISGNLWGRTLQGPKGRVSPFACIHAKKAPKHGAAKGQKRVLLIWGLVLVPKRGLYDKYVLLLDFNSLYPSIIQEHNICFTTVERAADGSIPPLPFSKDPGLLKNLVQRRRMVESWMKNATGLKHVWMSGVFYSRFYAEPLAELITLQARQILQSTVDLVQINLNLEVIYGDTDSIMIYSGLDDISKAKAIAERLYKRCLEIDLDGLYKRMLLLKKKKYAAVKLHFKDGTPYEGLDMVRQDWSLLSKELGDFCLSQILSGGWVAEDMRRGQLALEKYLITKTLQNHLRHTQMPKTNHMFN
ncbi:hypothetical protein MLD38_040456 [Melastoma candidum]|nr:hypothetical protein MLD38_040456 [Melastoma candidum]